MRVLEIEPGKGFSYGYSYSYNMAQPGRAARGGKLLRRRFASPVPRGMCDAGS
jgi:hypothetical protein